MNFVSTRERWMHLSNFSDCGINASATFEYIFHKRAERFRETVGDKQNSCGSQCDAVDKGEERKRGMNNRVTRIRSQSS